MESHLAHKQSSPRKSRGLSHKQNIASSVSAKQQSNQVLGFLHQIVSQQQSSSVFFDMLLGDPNLKQMSENLQRQAQQSRKRQILTNFPKRYQQLLKTQKKYGQLCQQYDKKLMEIQNLEASLIQNTINYKKQVLTLQKQLNDRQACLQKAINQFQTRESEKQKQFRQLNDNLFRMKHELLRVQRANDELKHEIQLINNRNQQMSKDMICMQRKHQFQIETLRNDKQYANEQRKKLQMRRQAEQNQHCQKNKYFIQSLKQKQQQIIEWQKKARVSSRQIQSLKQQYQAKLEQKTQEGLIVRQKYLHSIQEIQELQNQYQVLKEQFNQQRSEHLNLQGKYAKQKDQWAEGQQFLRMIKLQLNKLKTQHQKSLKFHVQHIQQLTLTNSSLGQKISNLQNQLASSKSKCLILEKQNKRITGMLQNLENQYQKYIQSSGSAIQPLNQKIGNLRTQLQDTLDNEKAIKKKINSLQRRFEESQTQNHLLRQSIESLKSDKQQLIKERQQSRKFILSRVQQYRNQTLLKISKKQIQLRQLKQIVGERSKQLNLAKQRQKSSCQRRQCEQILENYKKQNEIIDRMKQQIVDLFSKIQQKSTRQKQLFKEVLQQNKMLRGFC